MNRPRAAPPVLPLPGHRTMAEVDRDERYLRSRQATPPAPKENRRGR